jgi:hypothetical protein
MTEDLASHHKIETHIRLEAAMKRSSPLPVFRILRSAMPTMVGAVTFLIASTAQSQELYKTPDDAASALVTAAKTGDSKALLTVLGPGAADIASSGDAAADADARSKFINAYDAKHQVAMDGDKKAVLIVGQQDWPFPIPLTAVEGGWRFDTAAGREEILARRIGRNELDAIQSCLAYVDAQTDYAALMHASTGVSLYAQRIVSQPGKKDGLYWPTEASESPSPLGELVASATRQGYRVGGGRTPFHGYYYKILTRQGPAAPGGAYDYVVRGKMIGGFALVAYPATYRNSGVMTFSVSHDGTVFERDLGPQTAQLAEQMTSFNPDHTWKKVMTETSPQ